MVSLVNRRSERSWLVVCACAVNAGKLSRLQCSFVGWLGSDAKSWMGHRDWTSYDDRGVPRMTRGPPHPIARPPWDDSVDTETLLFPPQICVTKLPNGKHRLPDDPSDSVGASSLLETCKKKKKRKKQAEKWDRKCILKTLSCNYGLIFSHWNCTGNFADGE